MGAINPTVDAATTLAGFDVSRILLDNNRIGLNFSGLSYTDGTVVRINFQKGDMPVPEPAAWMMMIVGFGAVGGMMRRRKVRTTVTYA